MIDINRLCKGCMREIDDPQGICPVCGYDNREEELRSTKCLPYQTILQGRYLLGRVLGEGGFGITYLALDLVTQTVIAIKEYFPVGLSSRDMSENDREELLVLPGELGLHFRNGLERFTREGKILSRFQNLPGIVNARDFFFANATAYLVMDYVEGQSLKQYMKWYQKNQNGTPMDYHVAVAFLEPVIQSLIRIHQAGLLHRDISPDNILVDNQGHVTLIDFGSAREDMGNNYQTMTVMVKHGYAPEEQYRAHGKQGPWSDVYALCATLYHMISGTLPMDAVERLAKDELIPLKQLSAEIPEAVSDVIEKGMAIRAADRYKTMEELHQDLMLAMQQQELRDRRSEEARRAAEEQKTERFTGQAKETQSASAPEAPSQQVTQAAWSSSQTQGEQFRQEQFQTQGEQFRQEQFQTQGEQFRQEQFQTPGEQFRQRQMQEQEARRKAEEEAAAEERKRNAGIAVAVIAVLVIVASVAVQFGSKSSTQDKSAAVARAENQETYQAESHQEEYQSEEYEPEEDTFAGNERSAYSGSVTADGSAAAPETSVSNGTVTAPETSSANGTVTAPETSSANGTATIPETSSANGTATVPETSASNGTVTTPETTSSDAAGTARQGASVTQPESQQQAAVPVTNSGFYKDGSPDPVNGYILPESATGYLTESDLSNLTLKGLCYAKNEIYARYGRRFLSSELQTYFNGQSWYSGTYEAGNAYDSTIVSRMNEYERSNKDLLNAAETKLGSYKLDQ